MSEAEKLKIHWLGGMGDVENLFTEVKAKSQELRHDGM